MLIAPLYHKIGSGKYANSLETLEQHLAYIAAHFSTVLPGENLPKGTSVCLTFDDAFFDFYHLVFPLLQKYNLKALLAVPTAYIPESTDLSPMERLEKVASFPDKAPPIPSPAFCTWEELQVLSQSPLIQIASHSLHHRPFTSKHINIENELFLSKKLLEEKLSTPISSFVYPFGLFTQKAQTLAKKHYKYIFRIGSAHNISWKNTNQLLYRINADELPTTHFPFDPLSRWKLATRFFLNTVRGR
ncbi:polysaccharide deacetylase family protein [Candidatus Neptunichlamydia sp. REUL1]|uniref:polysaccharide deacetylase family protein n=1 Tax=Candidatus Neptunichlamydia sp. REUL1 TaxID=3064277 RepID=UPI00293076C8|nr:polysaccharide deacetylase family protein [Candidatus Neptunochlamydia sp. REUL1]